MTPLTSIYIFSLIAPVLPNIGPLTRGRPTCQPIIYVYNSLHIIPIRVITHSDLLGKQAK